MLSALMWPGCHRVSRSIDAREAGLPDELALEAFRRVPILTSLARILTRSPRVQALRLWLG